MSDRQLLTIQCGTRFCTAFAEDVQSIRLTPIPDHSVDMSLPLWPLLGTEEPVGRMCGLLITIRRRTIALLVDAVDYVVAPYVYHPFPPLIAQTGHAQWVSGVMIMDSTMYLHLDLRALALHARSAYVR